MRNTADSDTRRRFVRILFDAPVTLKTQDASYPSQLIDISLKGALVRCPEHWQAVAGDPVELAVSLDQTQTQIRMQVQLAHARQDQIGFICKEIDIDSITHLRRLVELNLGDADLLERELEALG